jgi:ribosomal protein L31E
MKSIDYIIPVCNIGDVDFKIRCENISFILKEFLAKQTEILLNVIIVEQVTDSKLDRYQDKITIPENLKIKILTVQHPTFIKPWLYNIGFRNTISDNIIFGEADVYSDDANYFSKCIGQIEGKIKWCFIWYAVKKLTEQGRTKLLNFKQLSDNDYHKVFPAHNCCEGMGVYFNKAFFKDCIGWANEFFKELGGNDNELAYRAWKASGEYIKYPSTLIHLWHPKSILKPGNPNNSIKDNKKLRVYVTARPEAFTNFLKEKDLGGPKPLNANLNEIGVSPILITITQLILSGMTKRLNSSILDQLEKQEKNNLIQMYSFKGDITL